MRSLVLNSASVSDLSVARRALAPWLRDTVSGMSQLIDDRVARPELLMRHGIHEVRCLPECSLFDIALDLLRSGARDEYEFLLTIAARECWTEEIAPAARDRLVSCEQRELPGPDGEPLMLCVVIGGIAVGFPSNDLWKTDRVEIRFDEMLPSGEIEPRTENIDNLTCSVHARRITERHRRWLRSCASAAELWQRRGEAFPNLLFGPGVEANLAILGGHLTGVAEKLSGLDAAAEAWKNTGGGAPGWKSTVTREAASTRADPKLMAARQFASAHGGTAMFEWHARYGSGGRIHLRFDARTQEIEIGYIGHHLPL